MIPTNLIKRGQYWTDSLTLVSGCSAVSEGCANCWSAGMASRFDWGKPYAKNGKWTGKVEPNTTAYLKLDKRAKSKRKLKPKVIQIWNDLFHDEIPTSYISQCFGLMSRCPDTFLVLTKRAHRLYADHEIKDMLYESCNGRYSNIYIGVSVESQKHTDRIDYLDAVWSGGKFVSIEPCLGAVDMSSEQLAALDQVIIGCESGAGRRKPPSGGRLFEMIEQCTAAGIPLFLKQWDVYGKLVKMPEVFGQKFSQLAWSKTLTEEVIEKGETG